MRKLLISCVLFFSSFNALAEKFNTIDAVGSALNMKCMDYCLVGVCIHLRCSWNGCSLSQSFKVKHNLPEFIVSVYDEVSEQPYTEYRPIQELATSWIGNKGASLMQEDKLNSMPLVFKNASVLGHPFLLFANPPMKQEGVLISSGNVGDYSDDPQVQSYIRWNGPMVSDGSFFYIVRDVPDFTAAQEAMGAKIDEAISSTFSLLLNNPIFKGFCPSNVEFFRPYYDSNVDFFEWRFGVIDRLKALQSGAHIPGRREIGSLNSLNPVGKNTWGAVYPRTGFVLQTEDPKAAAVIAQRAVDIVTRNDSWRIKKHAPVGASNEKTDKWQMISPKEDSSCSSFGNKNSNWSDGRNPDGKGQYAWNYWGGYSCCLGGGNVIQVLPLKLCLNDIF